MSNILQGIKLVEASAFVAAPLAGLTLAQLGADVIRIDPIGGGLDYRRWPITSDGRSLYWAGLNKGKRSIAIDLRRPEGRELAAALITRAGDGGGLFLTNLPPRDWTSYERLSQRRPDLIMAVISGNRDGSTAVDYTVNAATGLPFLTGPEGCPVNHVLPAWDIAAGLTAAIGILAAERHRRETGSGQLVKLALSDTAFAMLSHLGYLAEVQIQGRDRPSVGNDVYGTFGREFPTRDGRRIMVVTVTQRQWRSLVAVTGLADKLPLIEQLSGGNLDDEGDRFRARELIGAVLAPWFSNRTVEEIRPLLEEAGVLCQPFQTMSQLIAEDPRCSTANPMFANVAFPAIGTLLTAGVPLDFAAVDRTLPAPAPVLGQDTEAVLAEDLGLASHEIGRLRDSGLVAGPGQ